MKIIKFRYLQYSFVLIYTVPKLIVRENAQRCYQLQESLQGILGLRNTAASLFCG